MTTLTVTTGGQVTFRKDVLKHLGIKPGGKIALELLPCGKASLSAGPTGTIDGFLGILAGKGKEGCHNRRDERGNSRGLGRSALKITTEKVFNRVYRLSRADVGGAIRALLAAVNVETDRPAVEAGLAMLEAGGDFADGVIAHEGAWLGGDTFVSFDKAATGLLKAKGYTTRLLS